MARNYNVNILISVLLNGVEGATRLLTGGLQPAIDNVTKSSKELGKETERTLDSFDQLERRINELRKIKGASGRKLGDGVLSDNEKKELYILNKAFNDVVKVSGNAADTTNILAEAQRKLIAEGVAGYKELNNTVSKLNSSLKALDDIKIGGTESVKRLQETLNKLEEGKDIKLDIDAASAIEETKKVEQNLRKLLDEASTGGDLEGFKNIANILSSITNTRREVEKLVAERNKLDAKPIDIRVRLKEETPKVREDLKNFKKEFELAKTIGLGVEFRSQGATDRLNAIIKQVASLKRDAQSIGQDTIDFDINLREIQELKKELKTVGDRKDRIAREAITIKVTNLNELKDLDKQARQLLTDLEAAKKAGNIKLVIELQAEQGRIQARLNAIKKPIDDLAASAKKVSLIENFEGVQSKLNAATKSVQGFGQAQADAAKATEIANQKSKTSISDLGIEFRRLGAEVEKATKSGNFSLSGNFDNELTKLKASLQQVDSAQLSPDQFKVFTKVSAEAEKATDSLNKYKSANLGLAEESQIDAQKTVSAIKSIVSEASRLSKVLEKAKATGNFEIDAKITLDTQALVDKLNKLDTSGKIFSESDFKALAKAKADVDVLVDSVNNFSKASVAAGQANQESLAKLANAFANTNQKLKDLQTKLNKAKEIGEALVIKPQIEIETGTLIADLKDELKQAQKLGQSTTAIRLKLEKAEQFKRDLNIITAQTDELAKKKIVVKAEIDRSIRDAERDLAQINSELDKAIKRKDTRIIVDLQVKADSVAGTINRLQRDATATGTKSQVDRVAGLSVEAAKIQKQIDNLGNSTPTIGKKLGNAFRLAAQDAGGARGAITGLASTLRLVGTSAFVVGGQLRTLGFGFSALASIVQNIGPVVFQFAAGLAKAGPPGLAILGVLTAIGTTATVVAGKIVLITGALGALIDTGFEYNSALEQTKNASAALAQEFFNFSVNGEKVNDTIEIGGRILTKYQVAQLAVEQQFQGLQSAALTTIFTNKELLGTFQNIILSSKGLAPSLESVTALTGQFARVAGLIGISAEKLASQVNLVLSGAGRVTSPLQRFLNAAKDSTGVELTAKRIRELRAEGGDVLFNELTTAIGKFDEALKQANRASFAGVISNFQDLFEQVSQLATKSVFDSLRDGLADVVDRLTQKVKLLNEDGTVKKNKAGEEVTDVRPSKALLSIAETASKIFAVINRDIIKLVNFLVDKLDDIAKFLEDNYKNIVSIYEVSKEILITFGKLVLTFTRLFTLSSDTNSQLKSTITVLDTIVVIVNAFRVGIDSVNIGVNVLLYSLGIIPILLGKALLKASQLGDFLFNFNQESAFTKSIRESTENLDKFLDNREMSAKAALADIDDAAKETGDIVTGKTSKAREEKIIREQKRSQTDRIEKGLEESSKQFIAEQGKLTPEERKKRLIALNKTSQEFFAAKEEDLQDRLKGGLGKDLSKFETKDKITSTGTGKGTASDAEKKGRQRSQKSELADRKALVDEIRKLGVQREQNELKLIQDRIAQQKDLTEAALEQNLISQQAASKKILDLKNQEINNEVTTRRNAIALLNAERLDKERAFQAEKLDIEKNAKETGEQPRVTKSKLDVLDLKQSADLISNKRELLRLQGEIDALEQGRSTATFEYLKTLQGITKENRKQLEDSERAVVEAQDLNDAETLRFRNLDAVREKIEEIISIENQIRDINELLVGESDPKVISILNKQIGLLERRLLLSEKEIGIKQRLQQLQALENLASELKNNLSNEEAALNLKVSTGFKSERDALVEATAQRIKYKAALLEILEAEEEALNAPVNNLTGDARINNVQRRDNIAKLKQELNELKTVIDDKELIQASNSIKDNFVSLFDSLQDGTKSVGESFADLGRSILGTFRNLISKRLTEELFGSLFPTPGQTDGKVTGIFGKLFEKLGLGTAKQDQQRADALAKSGGGVLSPEQRESLDAFKKAVQEGDISVRGSIRTLSEGIRTETEEFRSALSALTEKIKSAGIALGVRDPNDARAEAKKITSARKSVGSTATEEALNSPELNGEKDPVPVTVKGVEIGGVKTTSSEASKAIGIASGVPSVVQSPSVSTQVSTQGTSDIGTLVKAATDRIIASLNTESSRLVAEISGASYRTQPISIVDSGQLLPTISTYFSSLNSNISVSIGAKLDEVIRLLSTAGSVSSSSSPLDILGGIGSEDGNARGGIIRRAYGGLAGFISGGAIKGDGGFRNDSVPARLSNGEYVVQAPVVKSLGERFFDYVNSTGMIPAMAAGGALFTNTARAGYKAPTIDTSKYDYSGGGAKLLKLPEAIVQPTPPKPKKIGGLRKFFGNLLGAIAPFLNFIPVIGPFLAIGAGAAGGALLGEDKKSSIIGGILGGLGNAGGLGKFGGALGSFGKFFGSSGTGGKLTSLFSGLGGSKISSNSAGAAGGNFLLDILKKFGKFGGKANGGIIQNFAGGGLSKIFSGLGGNGGSGGGSNSTAQLALLFGLSSILGQLGGKQNSESEFVEVVVDDPDADRKNRYGSAYRPLIEQGIIPDYKYNEQTLQALLKQQEGYKNVIRAPKKSGFLSFITQLLPIIGGLMGSLKLGGAGASKSLVDSPLGGGNPLGDVFAASGGLIQRLAGGGSVLGAGTATSDSIPALLSNGEYVIKASSVKMLGTEILDSINAGRFTFADGGLVAPGISSLPESHPALSSPNVNVDGRVTVVNQLDPALFSEYLRSSDGQRMLINTIGRNKKAVRQTIN